MPPSSGVDVGSVTSVFAECVGRAGTTGEEMVGTATAEGEGDIGCVVSCGPDVVIESFDPVATGVCSGVVRSVGCVSVT